METKEIKDKIQLAITLVEDVPEPFKTKAFEVILSNLLEGSLPKKTPPSFPKEAKESSEIVQSLEDKIERLAKIADIEVSRLKDIFQFEEKEPMFIGRVEGTEAERQAQISRLMILVCKEVYGKEWVEGSFLWKVLGDYGVGSLQHLARNLERRENEFRMMGQGRGRKYKLTEQGRQNAVASLRQ